MLQKLVAHQPLRFLVVGGINTVVGYMLYAIGVIAGLAPEIALIIATSIGVIFNYLTTGALVFNYRSIDRLLPFVLVYGVVYVLNVVALRLLIGVGVGPLVAQALLVPVAATLSFLSFRKFIFVRPKEP